MAPGFYWVRSSKVSALDTNGWTIVRLHVDRDLDLRWLWLTGTDEDLQFLDIVEWGPRAEPPPAP